MQPRELLGGDKEELYQMENRKPKEYSGGCAEER
jgi:hypothetical protein